MTERDTVENGRAWRIEGGWCVQAFDDLHQGEGPTLDDAVEDLLGNFMGSYIAEMPEDTAIAIDDIWELRLLGPKEDGVDEVEVVHLFDIIMPRVLTSEELMVYEAMARPLIEVDEEHQPWIMNLPLEWQ